MRSPSEGPGEEPCWYDHEVSGWVVMLGGESRDIHGRTYPTTSLAGWGGWMGRYMA